MPLSGVVPGAGPGPGERVQEWRRPKREERREAKRVPCALCLACEDKRRAHTVRNTSLQNAVMVKKNACTFLRLAASSVLYTAGGRQQAAVAGLGAGEAALQDHSLGQCIHCSLAAANQQAGRHQGQLEDRQGQDQDLWSVGRARSGKARQRASPPFAGLRSLTPDMSQGPPTILDGLLG